MININQLIIIILNFQTYRLTQDCVEQLLKVGIKNHIIIVDNCSPNGSYEKLKKYFIENEQIIVVQSDKNGGYSYGNNYGIHIAEEISTYKYICIINPDVILENNILEELCKKLSISDDYAAISALMFMGKCFSVDKLSVRIPNSHRLYKEHMLYSWSNSGLLRYCVLQNGLIQAETLPGSFFIIRYDIFKEIGFFDENVFLYNEENIIGIKLKKLGYKCVIDTECHFVHNHIDRTREQVWRRYRYEFNNVVRDYQYGYESRKYLCQAYFHGKNLGKLKMVNLINLVLLYIKHYCAFIVYRCSGKLREEDNYE